MQTRAQKYSKQAYEHISFLKLDDTQKKLYGSICHDFPVMVLRSGLAQAVAFLWIKYESSKSEKKPEGKPAYKEFQNHLSSITGQNDELFSVFQKRIHEMSLDEYQRTTRIILNAGIWYKRFAESLLDVKAGEPIEDTYNTEEE